MGTHKGFKTNTFVVSSCFSLLNSFSVSIHHLAITFNVLKSSKQPRRKLAIFIGDKPLVRYFSYLMIEHVVQFTKIILSYNPHVGNGATDIDCEGGQKYMEVKVKLKAMLQPSKPTHIQRLYFLQSPLPLSNPSLFTPAPTLSHIKSEK